MPIPFTTPFRTPALPATPVERMADELADAHAAKGFAEIHDLTVLGWPARDIERLGPDAVVLSASRATRQLDADLVPLRRAA